MWVPIYVYIYAVLPLLLVSTLISMIFNNEIMPLTMIPKIVIGGPFDFDGKDLCSVWSQSVWNFNKIKYLGLGKTLIQEVDGLGYRMEKLNLLSSYQCYVLYSDSLLSSIYQNSRYAMEIWGRSFMVRAIERYYPQPATWYALLIIKQPVILTILAFCQYSLKRKKF